MRRSVAAMKTLHLSGTAQVRSGQQQAPKLQAAFPPCSCPLQASVWQHRQHAHAATQRTQRGRLHASSVEVAAPPETQVPSFLHLMYFKRIIWGCALLLQAAVIVGCKANLHTSSQVFACCPCRQRARLQAVRTKMLGCWTAW